jgi:hypothetical protein
MGARYSTGGWIGPVSNSQPFREATASVQNATRGGILDGSRVLVARVIHADTVLKSSSGKQTDRIYVHRTERGTADEAQ